MEKQVSIYMVNELLKKLGHENILVTNTPIFYWNGNTVTDETAPIKQVSTFRLNEDFNFSDLLTKYADNKIVFMSNTNGKLLNEHNEIRVFIDS